MLHSCTCRAGMLPPLKRLRAFVSTANVLSLVSRGAATGSPDLRVPSDRQALRACAGFAKAAAPVSGAAACGFNQPGWWCTAWIGFQSTRGHHGAA